MVAPIRIHTRKTTRTTIVNNYSRAALLKRGDYVMTAFCSRNDMPVPALRLVDSGDWIADVCAFYRDGVTHICISRCASIGRVGRQWSFPGYTVDRTPYGVLQHELGHHVDVQRSAKRGKYFGDFSAALRGNSGEQPITTYCPNDAEWFAEMFRVFVTNPDLLRLLRPRTYRELRACFEPVFADAWRDRLRDAPARTIAAAEKKIEAAAA